VVKEQKVADMQLRGRNREICMSVRLILCCLQNFTQQFCKDRSKPVHAFSSFKAKQALLKQWATM
jgi:hypothetical protein